MATLTLPTELLQRHVEALFGFEADIRLQRETELGRGLRGVEVNTVTAMTAAKMGWLDVAPEAVLDMPAGEVLRIASAVNEMIRKTYEVPGE